MSAFHLLDDDLRKIVQCQEKYLMVEDFLICQKKSGIKFWKNMSVNIRGTNNLYQANIFNRGNGHYCFGEEAGQATW